MSPTIGLDPKGYVVDNPQIDCTVDDNTYDDNSMRNI